MQRCRYVTFLAGMECEKRAQCLKRQSYYISKNELRIEKKKKSTTKFHAGQVSGALVLITSVRVIEQNIWIRPIILPPFLIKFLGIPPYLLKKKNNLREIQLNWR